MSLKVQAFYGAQYLGNETTIDDIDRMPDDTYLLMNGHWYQKVNSATARIAKVDLPAEIKAQLALLGILP